MLSKVLVSNHALFSFIMNSTCDSNDWLAAAIEGMVESFRNERSPGFISICNALLRAINIQERDAEDK